MATTKIAAFRSALAALISTQLTNDAVTGVTVREFPPGDEHARTDQVYLGRVSADQEPLTMGGSGSRQEDLEAQLFIYCETAGAGDTVAATSEDRALTILASVESAVRNDITVSASVFNTEVESIESDPGLTPDGRYSLLRVTLTAEAHL